MSASKKKGTAAETAVVQYLRATGFIQLERDNDHATLGVVWHKRRGKGHPADWFVTMSGAQFTALLRDQQGLPAPAIEDGEAA